MAEATVVTNKGKVLAIARINGTGTAPIYVGFGTGGGSRTAAVGDTDLTTISGSRILGTPSITKTTIDNDTHTVTAKFTNTTGNTIVINEIMTFDAASGGNSCISRTLNGATLANGDSLTAICKLKA